MPVELDQEVCTNCRTPRDDMEMEEGRALVRKEELRLKRRPKLVAAVLAAAALLAAAWLLRGLVLGPLLVAWSDFQIEVEKTRQPSHWVKPRVFPAPAGPADSSRVAVSSFVFLTASGAPPAHAAYAAPPPAIEPEPEPAKASAVVATPLPVIAPPGDPALTLGPGEIRVHGTVYDLATARPVGNVMVRIQQVRGEAKWETATNEAGHYQLGLYKNAADAVTVMIEAPGYRKGLLEDKDPPYRERSAQARAEVIAETVDSDLEPVPLRYKDSERIIELDLVLVPQAKK
jgi:hypothetical protein